MRNLLVWKFALLAAVALPGIAQAANADRPSFILCMTDDQGWSDVSPYRYGVTLYGKPLKLEEKTVAQALAAAGYKTGHFGKWHLNGKTVRASRLPRTIRSTPARLVSRRGSRSPTSLIPIRSSAETGRRLPRRGMGELLALLRRTGDPLAEAFAHPERVDLIPAVMEKLKREYAGKPERNQNEGEQ